MNIEYTEQEYLTSKSTNPLKLKCTCCHNIFTVNKKLIDYELKYNRGRLKYCGKNCFNFYNSNKNRKLNSFEVECHKC